MMPHGRTASASQTSEPPLELPQVSTAEHLPPNAEDVRRIVEERLAAQREEGGLPVTTTIEWRGEQRATPVISMPVALLTYNPHTHRVRAQRSLDPARDAFIESEPYGDEAQAYLHHLLTADPLDPGKKDPKFADLKDDLHEHGQREPGIITREGVLINGNTRRAALKELDQPDIKVGVLPADAGVEDLQNIELSLQLRREYKRDYSFMNFLLAIDERVKAGLSAERIQRDFRIQQTTYDRSRWILSTVRKLIERSRIDGPGNNSHALRLVDFENDQGKLEELYRTYSKLKGKDPVKADALLEQRLLAVLVRRSKTDLRLIEPEFGETHLASVLPEVPSAEAPRTIPGTSIEVPAADQTVEQLRALTDRVAQARAAEGASKNLSPEVVQEAGQVLTTVHAAVDKGLKLEGRNSQYTKRRLEPADRVADASEALAAAADAVAKAQQTRAFVADDLDESLVALRASLVRLARRVLKGEEPDTEGLQWLLEAAREPADER